MTPIQTITPSKIETRILSNGTTLVYKAMPSAPRMSLYIAVHGGNRIEGIAGLADLIDSLMMQGTKTRSAETIAFDVDDIPLDLNIDTHRDYTAISATFLPENLTNSMALLADLLFNSTMADWEKEKVQTQGEITMQLDSPATLARDLLGENMYKGLPYQASLQNTLRSLPQMSSQEIFMDQYTRIFNTANMTITAVGPVSIDVISKSIEQFFSTSSHALSFADDTPVLSTSIPNNQYHVVAKNDSQQLHMFQGWFGPSYTDPDYTAMVILNTVLGGAGLSSRLFTEIRDKQGLAYNVRSQLDSTKYLGLFTLYIGTEPKNRERCLAGFAEEIRKLIEVPLTATELTDAKENALGRHVLFLEKAAQQAAYFGSKLAAGASIEYLENHRNRIATISQDDVQRVASRFLKQPNIVTAVGPEQFL